MSTRLPLLLVLLAASSLRLGLSFCLSDTLDQLPDQREYVSLAQNLRSHHSAFFADPRFDQDVYAYRMPGYPLFLALEPAALPQIRTARIEQCFIDLSTILAIYLAARHLTASRSIALIAAAFVAFNPFYIYFTGLILSETLFASLLGWSIYFLARRNRWSAVVLLTAACYVRPTGCLLLPALVIVGALNSGKTTAYRLSDVLRSATAAMLHASLTMILFLTPWALRNHHMLGSTLWTTTNGGITFYDGFHDGATGASDQRFVSRFPQLQSMNEVQRSEFFSQQAIQWIRHHWTAIPGLTARKILRGWSPVPLSRDFARPVYWLISVSYELPFDLLCLIGLFSRRLTRPAKWLLTTPALVVTLAQAVTVGSIRYRMPAEAPLAILAAAGAMDGYARIRRTWVAEV